MDLLGVYGMFLNNLWSLWHVLDFWISRNLFGFFSLLGDLFRSFSKIL